MSTTTPHVYYSTTRPPPKKPSEKLRVVMIVLNLLLGSVICLDCAERSRDMFWAHWFVGFALVSAALALLCTLAAMAHGDLDE